LYSYKTTGTVISNYSKNQKTILSIAVLDYLFSHLETDGNKNVFMTWL
jgi:hypothetical protein